MQLRILYIAGSGRCGSTVLDNILGQLPGVCAVGEVRSLWEIGLLDGRRCGCGQPTGECPFWRDVLTRSFDDGAAPDPAEVVAAQSRYLRLRPWQLAKLARTSRRADLPPALDRYLGTIERLYAGIAEAGGARLVVDSSKGPGDAFALAKFTELEIRVLHLVRDPRGVAHSWARAKPADDDRPQGRMKTMGSVSSSARWLAFNATIEAMLRPALGPRYLRLRYEDFVADPNPALERIMEFAGMPVGTPPLVNGRMAVEPTHSPSGNPDRVGRSEIRISADQRWRREMAPADRTAVALLSAPLLTHYGYSVRSAERDDAR